MYVPYQQCSHSCPHAVAVRREPFDQPAWTIRTEARRFPSSHRHRVWLLSASLTEYLRELLLIERKRIPATDRSMHGFPTAIHRILTRSRSISDEGLFCSASRSSGPLG